MRGDANMDSIAKEERHVRKSEKDQKRLYRWHL